MPLRKAKLYYNTLKYLRPSQIHGRFLYKLRRPTPDIRLPPPQRNVLGAWIGPSQRRPSLIGHGYFRFLGLDGKLSEIGWDGAEREKLWRYNQHYFDDLNAQENQKRADWHKDLLQRWLAENPPGKGSGWEPYPTSLRIVNWVKWALAGNTLSEDLHHSIAVQARWLMRRLEWHLLGNHLFSNAKALVFAGLYFQGAEAQKWLTQGLTILKREVPEQILSDGGHFERSTMYHALALEDMLDLYNLLTAYQTSLTSEQKALSADWAHHINAMLAWHNTMCHPDGEISFFNDAAFGISPSTRELFAYAARLGFDRPRSKTGISRLAQSGYTRLQTSNAVALIDAAPIGPDYLPGHAHADTLSFELSVFDARVFVNSGTSVYGLSQERLRQRGTKAHNTVTVDDENSSEVWSGFRVARRARAKGYHDGSGKNLSVACSHDGYTRLSHGLIHTRSWSLEADGLRVEDTLTNSRHAADARFHVHPDVNIHIGADQASGIFRLPNGTEIDWQCKGGLPRVEQTTWHPEFGVTLPTKCLVVPLRDGRASLSLSWRS